LSVCSAARESNGEMVSTTPASMTPTVSLMVDFSPTVGQTSNNGPHEVSFTRAIICEIASSCQACGTSPKMLCIAWLATVGPDECGRIVGWYRLIVASPSWRSSQGGRVGASVDSVVVLLFVCVGNIWLGSWVNLEMRSRGY
jgi:hypothetical protein